MKNLQNNFTTPEQSKRLLELGIPADSADCYLLRTHTKGDTFIVEVLHDELYSKKDKFTNLLEYMPCWSVGRLIEIYLTCALEYHPYDDFYTETPSLHITTFDKDNIIEKVIKIMFDDTMDFAKLDD